MFPIFYPFLLLFTCMNEEIRHESSNRGIILSDQSIKQGIHKIYPKKNILKQSVEERDTGRRCADKADTEGDSGGGLLSGGYFISPCKTGEFKGLPMSNTSGQNSS